MSSSIKAHYTADNFNVTKYIILICWLLVISNASEDIDSLLNALHLKKEPADLSVKFREKGCSFVRISKGVYHGYDSPQDGENRPTFVNITCNVQKRNLASLSDIRFIPYDAEENCQSEPWHKELNRVHKEIEAAVTRQMFLNCYKLDNPTIKGWYNANPPMPKTSNIPSGHPGPILVELDVHIQPDKNKLTSNINTNDKIFTLLEDSNMVGCTSRTHIVSSKKSCNFSEVVNGGETLVQLIVV